MNEILWLILKCIQLVVSEITGNEKAACFTIERSNNNNKKMVQKRSQQWFSRRHLLSIRMIAFSAFTYSKVNETLAKQSDWTRLWCFRICSSFFFSKHASFSHLFSYSEKHLGKIPWKQPPLFFRSFFFSS